MTETHQACAAVPASANTALVLPAELTIYTVGELHPQWVTWLSETAAPGAVGVAQVQAGAVDVVDAAGVQLLLSLQRALAAKGRRYRITGTSIALAAGCAGLGLSGWLQAQSAEAIA
jgi:ABC-type transporter Mla MlaB component